MARKLFVIALGLAVIAAALLVQRQRRLELAHEISEIHSDLRERERTLWELRGAIAEYSRPDIIRERLRDIDIDWVTIPDPTTFDADTFHPDLFPPASLAPPAPPAPQVVDAGGTTP
jgi:hypothetical protein